MINVLFIAEDTSRLLNKNFHYFEKKLSNVVNLILWRKSGHINYILKQLPIRPDFILLLNDIDKEMTPMIRGLSNIDIPTGLFVNDVHRFVNLRRNYITKNNIPYLFTVVRDKFVQTYPEFIASMEWFPHFADIEIYRDYGIQKDINLLMVGAVNDVYPLRQKIVTAYEGDPNFVHRRHPGYQILNKSETKHHFVGRKYAKEINRAKIVFTCPSIFHYPIIKYFEVLACKTLLLAPTFPELEDLGFIPGYHFVPIDESDFEQKAAYYLANATEREQIAKQGCQFIQQNHSVKHRVNQLVNKIEGILHKN